MKLIVGFGNPGDKYEDTRHNIGFKIIDMLAKELEVTNFRVKFQGLVGEANLDGEKVLLLKPQTFYNLLGNSVSEIVKFYKLDPKEDIIVVYDDLDLNPGKTKIKAKGSSGGNNGMKSMISHFGDEFLRVKCGIGKAKSKEATVNHVLGNFGKTEFSEEIDPMMEKAVKGIKSLILAKDPLRVIEKYNRR